jgi:hypothetical protein
MTSVEGGRSVFKKSPEDIWSEQYDATETIKRRYGDKSAFDYIVSEKLMNFAEAARQYPEFAREMPKFVAAIRRMFTQQEMSLNLALFERKLTETEIEFLDADDSLREDPATAAARIRQFVTIKELLSATNLGIA